MNRRVFMTGAAAALGSAALPLPSGAVTIGVDMAQGRSLMAFAVGTAEEMNWQPIFAESEDEAWRAFLAEWDDEDCFPYHRDECIRRVAEWDGKTHATVTPADWLRVGMGHSCSRCGDPAFLDDGALAVGSEAICFECLTFRDHVEADPDVATESLADLIACDGIAAAESFVAREGAAVPAEMWAAAIARAA